MAEKVTSLFGGHIAAFRNSTLLTAERTPIRSRCYVLHKLGSKGNAGGHSGREVIFADRARRRNNHVGPPQPGTSVRKPPDSEAPDHAGKVGCGGVRGKIRSRAPTAGFGSVSRPLLEHSRRRPST